MTSPQEALLEGALRSVMDRGVFCAPVKKLRFALDGIAAIGYCRVMLYTLKDLEERAGVHERQLRYRAQKLGLKKIGYTFILTEEQADMIVAYKGGKNIGFGEES